MNQQSLRFSLSAAVALAAALTGCRTTQSTPETTAKAARTTAMPTGSGISSTTDPGVVRSDFKTEVGPDQQVKVHLDLGRAHESQSNLEAAAYEYARAVEASGGPGHQGTSSSTKALAQRRLAGALDRLGRFTQAEVHYREALRLAPRDPRVWNDAGYSSYLQRNWPDAEQRLRSAARLDPADPRIQTNLGLALAAQGKSDEALAALTRAGGPAVAHANLGYLLAATGRTVEARQHYQTSLKLQPDLPAARDALAQLDRTPPATLTAARPAQDAALSRTSSAPAAAITPATPLAPASPTQPRSTRPRKSRWRPLHQTKSP